MALTQNESCLMTMVGHTVRLTCAGGTPSRQNVPFGRNVPNQAFQSKFTVAVDTSTSRLAAARPICSDF